MSVKWSTAVAAVAALGGCSQASSEENEGPLLELHAKVISSALPLSPVLEPALTFTPFLTSWGHTEFFVTGEHSGNFTLTSQFELQVYDAPPDEALIELTRGEPAIALGAITVVAPEHPSKLEWTRDQTGGTLVCADSIECGTPARNPCGSAAAPSCLGTLVPGKNWGNHGIANRHAVIYLKAPAAAGSIYSRFFAQGQPIAAGYSVVRYEPVWEKLSLSAQSEYTECQKRATDAALNQFNSDHGTNYVDHAEISEGGPQMDTRLLADWDGMMIATTVSEGCVLPGSQQILPATVEGTPLRLIMSNWSDL